MIHKILRLLLVLVTSSNPFATFCYGQEISPPMLLQPGNGDTLVQVYPSFSWSPAYPLNTSSDTKYTLRLVEIIGNQTPETAIQSNPELYSTTITNNIFTYPPSAPQLKNHKNYAWQIICTIIRTTGSGEMVNRKVQNLKSEVYRLVLWDEMSDDDCIPYLSTGKLDKRFYIFSDYVLKFKAKENINLSQLTYKITDLKGNALIDPVSFVPKDESGNFYTIPLKKYDLFRKRSSQNKVYILEAISPEGNLYKLKFTCN